MGRHTANGRHPAALQAELKAKMAAAPKPAAAPAAPKPPPAPVAPVSSAPPSLSIKEKLDALPDEDLKALALRKGVDETADRALVIAELVALGVEV